jgi:transcriptional repressor NrdR
MHRVDCPSCAGATRVLESRHAEAGAAVRRRRACRACGERFTTWERAEPARLAVRKRDGRLEPFDRAKLAAGLLRAAHKRPVDPRAVEELVAGIERECRAAGGELPAERIGEACLDGLRALDRIAYLQFAVVYKGFEDPGELAAELRRLGVEPQRKERVPGPGVPSGGRG